MPKEGMSGIALIAVIGFTFAALSLTGCEDPNAGGGTHSSHTWGSWQSNGTTDRDFANATMIWQSAIATPHFSLYNGA